MVWGGIALTNKTLLIQINRNFNSIRYDAEILRPHIEPHAAAIGDGFIVIIDDNVRPHRGGESRNRVLGHGAAIA